MLRDIRNLFEHEEEGNYYKPVQVSNFWSNNYIEYKRNKIRPSDLVFDYVHLLYYKFHKINPYHGGSYIDSLEWIKN